MTSSQRQFYKWQFLASVLTLCLAGQMQSVVLAEKPFAPTNLLAQAQTAIALDDKEALNAQADHAIQREITVQALVKKLLPTDTEGLPHQKFLIELSNGSTILIAHDLKYAPAVPIQPGDVLRIHGEYIWNKLGGLIHWTHHSDTPKHDSGWIDFNGMRYQ
jgi:Protein of unknown function (DUF3465)